MSRTSKADHTHRNFETFVRNHIENNSEPDQTNLDVEFSSEIDAKLLSENHDKKLEK
ncbi:hypothetical protein [Ammoniphilus resinae]|uniref:Uncharacterized protein n=1 Tax=Ammoniphilus resinae TaxID=861532 RepID=A0ABS4GKN5_9BACL|nr:hypothetical protein [Ammoniphilus resinae]MBP1930813.1 hypothetical protein [Ammoniphilus resinae]